MMIKVSNEFLDFDDEIEVEKQIKLFEDISTTDGDYSYAFDLQKTLHNTKLLGNPFPDNIAKPVYQRISAQLLGNSGAVTYDGYIRVERITDVYECSFFAGNNNWFGMISGHLTELDFSQYDVEQTEENIIASWGQSEGIVFPFLDNGGLVTRSYPELKIEDFVGAFYIKTIFNRIFVEAGIKIQGELLEDWHFNNAICIKSSKDQEEINARSAYVQKTPNQVIADNTLTKVTYDDDSTFPFHDGSSDLWDLTNNQYVADVKMNVRIESTISLHTTGIAGTWAVSIYINGVLLRSKIVFIFDDTVITNSFSYIIQLNAGDVMEIKAIQNNVDDDAATLLSGTLRITPIYIYKTFGSAAVPNWTSQQFVSNVLRIFNVLPSYNAGTATLTLNLFEKLKAKSPLDLSEYVSDTEVDYQEFVSDYAQKSKLGYNEVDFDDLKAYNKGKIFKYGQGVIDVNNGFLEDEDEILKSDFSNPVDYVNAVFDCSVGKTNLIELENGEEVTFDDVADNGAGLAAFHISSEIFKVGDLVRIYDASNSGYNGDYIVDDIPTGHVVFNSIPFDTASTGKIVKLLYNYSSDENIFLFINIPNYEVSKFAGNQMFFDDGTEITSTALAYFNMISTGRQVNADFIYSMSFGRVDDTLAYQVPIIETHFRLFSNVLNDPVKLISTALLPYDVYNRIDFLRPITIKTLETSNMYYLNRVSGYKESYLPCTLELIKLPGGIFEVVEADEDSSSGGGGGGGLPSGSGFPYTLPFAFE